MIVGEATTTVAGSPRDVFEFVLDLKRYRQADRKIGHVGTLQRDGDTGTVVTHREEFHFKRPWRWVAEPLLRRWLESATAEEMVRFKALLDGESR